MKRDDLLLGSETASGDRDEKNKNEGQMVPYVNNAKMKAEQTFTSRCVNNSIAEIFSRDQLVICHQTLPENCPAV